jgi:subtilase-type serine protease
VGLQLDHRRRLRVALLGTSALVGASFAASGLSHAQSTWQGTTSAYGTAGNWDNNTPPIAGGTAFFGNGGLAAVNVGSPIAPDGWTFAANAQSYNVDGAAVTFTGAGILNLATSGTITIANNISGVGAIQQNGAGTLILSGTNTYTGDTHVRAGTLKIDSSNALPATTNVTVNTGATLNIGLYSFAGINSLNDGPNGGGTILLGIPLTEIQPPGPPWSSLAIGTSGGPASTFSGTFGGYGGLDVAASSLTLTGSSTISGDLTVRPGATLTITGPGASMTAGGSVTWVYINGTTNVLNGASFNPVTLDIEGSLVYDGKGTTGQTLLAFIGAAVTPPPGSANLVVSGGAVLESFHNSIIEDETHPTTPSVIVTGAGSTWNLRSFGGYGLYVGGYDAFSQRAGNLTISDGGVVNVTEGVRIGSDPVKGHSTVMVTGAGSQFNVDNLFVGGDCSCGLTGTLTVTDRGALTVTGTMVIAELATLKIGTGGFGGTVNAPAIGNNGQIIADFTDTIALASNITGIGTLTKQGPGNLILTGASTYSGLTTVSGGTLSVNGSITSDVVVNGGALGGTGVVGSTTIADGGALAPGNSIGTITIDGSLTFAGAGNYIVEVSPTNGLADRTNVIGAPGTADLAGTVTAVGTGYGYKIGSTYTVLNATGGVNNTFSSLAISGSFGSTRPRVEYDANNVYLLFDANAFALAGLTPNQTATATAINTALQQGIQLAAFDAAFNAPNGLDLVSGEVHASALSMLMDESLYPRQAVLGRLRQASHSGSTSMASLGFGGPQAFATDGTGFDSALAFAKSPIVRKAPLRAPQASGHDLVFWAQGFGAWGKFDSDGNAANVRRDLAGFFTGVDTRAGTNGRIGIAAGYTGSKVTLDGRGTANIDTGHVMAYGGWNFGALNLRAGGAFAHHSINTDRTIALPGFFDRTFSSTAGYTGQVFGEAGYGFNMQGIALEAFAGAAWVRVHANGTTERGGDAALNVGARSFEAGYSTLGLRAATIVPLANSMILVPRVTLAWQHAFGGTTPGVVNAFAAVPALPFAIQGVPIARDSLLAEAGVDVAITPQMTLGVSYTGQIARNVSDHGAKGKFSYRF